MPISDSGRQEIIAGCTRFLGPRSALTFAEKMAEVASSDYAKMPSDHYGNGGFVTEFEKEVAELLGKESAVFMPSGTMAQPIALRIWCDQTGNNLVAFHPTCHLELHEHGAYRELHHLEATLLGEANRLFTIADLEAVTELPAVLLIELPQREIGGQLPSWDELVEITNWARDKGIRLHLDGARLWECQSFYKRSCREICDLFDSVYVSFYKVIGGLPGAILAGPKTVIDESRIWLRRQGGNLQTQAPSAISARLGMDRELPRIAEYCARAGEIAIALKGLKNLQVIPPKPPTNMMHWHLTGDKDRIEDAIYEAARAKRLLLFRSLTPTDTPNVWKVEVTISGRALDIKPQEIREILEQALAEL